MKRSERRLQSHCVSHHSRSPNATEPRITYWIESWRTTVSKGRLLNHAAPMSYTGEKHSAVCHSTGLGVLLTAAEVKLFQATKAGRGQGCFLKLKKDI